MTPRFNRSVPPIAPLARPTERCDRSHGRTDGRTDVEGGTGDLSSADRNARTRIDEFLQRDRTDDIASTLDELEWRAGGPHRYPIIRSGERDDIPWVVRCAVYIRDDATCQSCGLHRPRPSELDHIVPWSAGGCDHAHNLRLTCMPCNQNRSNHHDHAEHFAKRSVTWWCCYCYPTDHEWTRHASGACVEDCLVPRIHDGSWYWAMDPVDVDSAAEFVFCAHCRDYGYTEPRCLL